MKNVAAKKTTSARRVPEAKGEADTIALERRPIDLRRSVGDFLSDVYFVRSALALLVTAIASEESAAVTQSEALYCVLQRFDEVLKRLEAAQSGKAAA